MIISALDIFIYNNPQIFIIIIYNINAEYAGLYGERENNFYSEKFIA